MSVDAVLGHACIAMRLFQNFLYQGRFSHHGDDDHCSVRYSRAGSTDTYIGNHYGMTTLVVRCRLAPDLEQKHPPREDINHTLT